MNTIIAQPEKSFKQNMGYALRKYTTVFHVSIANNLAYMGEVVFRTIFLVVFVYVFLQLWTATFAAKGIHSLSGFRISDMVWYLATTGV